MRYEEALSAKLTPSSGKKPKLSTIEIAKAGNGGHALTHKFGSGGGSYQEPEIHRFSANEGNKLIAHLKEHMGIKVPNGSDEGSNEIQY